MILLERVRTQHVRVCLAAFGSHAANVLWNVSGGGGGCGGGGGGATTTQGGRVRQARL